MSRVCHIVLVVVLSSATGVSAQVATSPFREVALTAHDTRAVAVKNGSGPAMVDLLLDPANAGGDVVTVEVSGAGAVVSVLLPDGKEITSSTAASLGYEYVAMPRGSRDDTIQGLFPDEDRTRVLVRLPPMSIGGRYRVKVDTAAVLHDVIVIASYASSSPVRAGLRTDARQYRRGDEVLLFALVFDGSSPIPAPGTHASARVGPTDDPQAAISEVEMADSGRYDAATGDGIYTGTFHATAAGEFTIAARVVGISLSGVAFSRVVSTTFRVVDAVAAFQSFEASGADNDDDGLIDSVVVTANIDVAESGTYQCSVTLVSEAGLEAKSSIRAALGPGGRALHMTFPAAVLGNGRTAGPFMIKKAILVSEREVGAAIVDSREDAGVTNVYRLAR